MRTSLGWSDFSLRSKGLIVVGLPAAATVVLAGAMYIIDGRSSEAERRVNHTLQVREEIQRLKANEIEASANAHGYLITADKAFSDQTRQSLESFDAARQSLADLTSDDPIQTRLLNRLAILERSRSAGIIAAMTRFEWGALSRDQMPAVLKESETERLQMDAVLKEMCLEEDRVLELELLRVNALRAELREISAVCVFLGVTGGMVISILFAAGITRRIGRLQRNVARLEAGEIFEPLEGGRDEIGELSEGIETAAKRLWHLTRALQRSVNGVAEIDAQGYLVEINGACGRLTGLPELRPELRLTDIVHPEERSCVAEVLAQPQARQLEMETRLVRPDGEAVHVEMTFVPNTENGTDGYLIFLRDIGPRKKAEAALVQAKNDAVAASLAKNRFLAKISHDIRTPLNAILGAADLLLESPLDSRQAGYVSLFQRNCTRLVGLINDFLDFSKIEAGAIRVENVPYRIRDTVEEATATFRHLALKKGVTLEANLSKDVPEWICGDPLRVHQVLVNLLSNAMKFTQQGSVEVKVNKIAGVEGAEMEAERLRFSVSDSGPGIRSEDQLRIFGPSNRWTIQAPECIRAVAWGWPSAATSSSSWVGKSGYSVRQVPEVLSISICRSWRQNQATRAWNRLPRSFGSGR